MATNTGDASIDESSARAGLIGPTIRGAQDREPRRWLNYRQAAEYCGWTVGHLRNMVSAGQIPVYGKKRSRHFRRDMLDEFLTDPDAAMRRFRAERNRHGS